MDWETLTITTIRFRRKEYESIVFSFSDYGMDFNNKLSYLQPYDPEEFIYKAHLLMCTFEVINDYVANDDRTKQLKKIRKKLK